MRSAMRKLAEVSEKREALNNYLSSTRHPDSAKVTELRGSLDAAEQAFRDSVNEDTFEEDDATFRRVTDRIEIRNYMSAVLRGDRFTGAEAEVNRELGLSDMNVVPWEALDVRDEKDDSPGEVYEKKKYSAAKTAAGMAKAKAYGKAAGKQKAKAEAEERADAVTPLAASAIGHPQQQVLPRIFQKSRTAFMGIRMPMVASGEPVYPVITAGAVGDAKVAGAAIDAEAATFTGVMVSPTRLSARYLFRIEDAARFPVEDSLRADLRNVMNELYDTQVISGDGGADGDMTGIITALGAAAVEATLTDFNQVITKHYSYVDGKAAAEVSEVRTLMGMKTYEYLATLFQGASGEQIYALLNRLGIETAAYAGIAAPVANVQQAIQTRRGTDAIAPVWQGITMIRDPYTGAAKGEVAITAHMLANFKFLRTDNWRKVAFKLAA